MKTQTLLHQDYCGSFAAAILPIAFHQRAWRSGIGLAALLAGWLLAGAGRAAQVVWTNTAGGNWSSTNNWSPHQVPGASDTAWITNNGTYTVTLNGNASIAGLWLGGTSGTQTFSQATYTLTLSGSGGSSANGVYTLASGTLTGNGSLAWAGPFNWAGGTLGSAASNLLVTANGGLTLSGASKSLYATLINGGAGTWSAGAVNCYGSALFSNAPNATLNFTADGSAFSLSSGSPLLVNANAGTFNKTAGTGTTTVNVPCHNGGSVQVNSGTLVWKLADSSGSFSVAAGNTLSVSGTATLAPAAIIAGAGNFTATGGAITNNGTFNVNGTNTFTGGSVVLAGSGSMMGDALLINGGTLILIGAGTIAPATLALSSGTLLGSQPVTVAGLFAWSGGTIGHAGSNQVITVNGPSTFIGAAKNLYATLINDNTATWSAGSITCYSGALFSNTPSGILDLTADGLTLSKSGTPALANAGLLRKSAGTGTATISVPCANSGTVLDGSGTLILTLDNSSGSFTNVAGGTLSVNGTATLAPAASIAGAGNFTVTAGMITNNGTFNVTGTNMFSGGTMVLAGSGTMTGSALIVNGGSLLLTGGGPASPSSLSLSAGLIAGTTPVAVSGKFTWSGGTNGSATSDLVVTAGGGVVISGPSTKYCYGTLINNGPGTWSGAAVWCYASALFSNTPAGSLDLLTDGTAFAWSGGNPWFGNAGLVRKSAGAGTNTIFVPFANANAVQVNSGTLALTNLVNGGGSFTVPAGGSLNVSGTATLDSGSSITGAGNYLQAGGSLTNHGTFNITGTNTFSGGTSVFAGTCPMTGSALLLTGGTLILTGAGSVTPASLTFTSGFLQGTMPVTVSGPFLWAGGTNGSVDSTFTVTANGGLTLSGGLKGLAGGTFINAASGTSSGNGIICSGMAQFLNASTGTLNLTSDGGGLASTSAGPIFVNAGVLAKTSGTGFSIVSVPCANRGLVQVNTGTVWLTLADSSGTFTAAAGATLEVNGTATLTTNSVITGAGNYYHTSGSSLTNNGVFNIAGSKTFAGTAVFNGDCSMGTGDVQVSGALILNSSGTLTPQSLTVSGIYGGVFGTMPVTVSGPFTWSGGVLGNEGSSQVFTANGGLTLSGGYALDLGSTLVNNSTSTWCGSEIDFTLTGVFRNTASSTLDLLCDGSSGYFTFSGGGVFVNEGLLRKSGGTGTTRIFTPFLNTGTVQANSGTLSFSSSFLQTTGQTWLNGGELAFHQTADFEGGTLFGSGVITGSISNNATVGIGPLPGVLAISGNYSEGTNAHLVVKLGGTSAGTDYDQLSVGGSATLAGTLDILYWNGFTPAAGDVFLVLSGGAVTGGFSAIFSPANQLAAAYTAQTAAVEPGNAPPMVKLTMPAQSLAGHAFLVTASAVDLDGTVTNLTLFLGTNVLVSLPGSPAQINFSSDFPGNLTFTAVATDNEGAQGTTNTTVAITTLPLLTLDAIGFQPNLAFKLCMLGVPGTDYQVWATTDLTAPNWILLGTMESTNGIWRYFDPTATDFPQRFYRAEQPP